MLAKLSTIVTNRLRKMNRQNEVQIGLPAKGHATPLGRSFGREYFPKMLDITHGESDYRKQNARNEHLCKFLEMVIIFGLLFGDSKAISNYIKRTWREWDLGGPPDRARLSGTEITDTSTRRRETRDRN